MSIKHLFVSDKVKVELLEDIISQLQSGDPTVDIANDMIIHGSSIEKELGKKIIQQIDQGLPISAAFKGIYSEIAVQCIAAGEEVADLIEGLTNATEALQSSGNVILQLLKSFAFPTMAVVGSILMMSTIGDKLITNFSGTIPVRQWPSTAKDFVDYVEYWNTSWLSFVMKVVLLLTTLLLALKYWIGKTREAVDSIPIFKEYRMLMSAQLLTTLSLMLKTGKSMEESVQFSLESGSKYHKYKVGLIERNFNNTTADSGNVGVLLDVNIMDKRQISRLIKRGDRADNITELLKKQSAEMAARVKGRINTFSFVVTKLLWAFAILNMAFFMFAIFDLSNQLSSQY